MVFMIAIWINFIKRTSGSLWLHHRSSPIHQHITKLLSINKQVKNNAKLKVRYVLLFHFFAAAAAAAVADCISLYRQHRIHFLCAAWHSNQRAFAAPFVFGSIRRPLCGRGSQWQSKHETIERQWIHFWRQSISTMKTLFNETSGFVRTSISNKIYWLHRW